MLSLSGGPCGLGRSHPETWTVSDIVEDAIRKASDKYGVPLGFMLGLAACESSFDPAAKNTLGSNEQSYGLFQFNILAWKAYSPEWLLDPYNNADLAASVLKDNYNGNWVDAAGDWYNNRESAFAAWSRWTQDGSLVGKPPGSPGQPPAPVPPGQPPVVAPPGNGAIIAPQAPTMPGFLIILSILGIAVIAALVSQQEE